MQGADVMELVSEQVLIGAPNDDRISCSGPLLVLDAQAAVHLALSCTSSPPTHANMARCPCRRGAYR